MSLPKLGTVLEGPDGDWIVTHRYPVGSIPPGGFVVLTPIPKDCIVQDLGSKFFSAYVSFEHAEPVGHLWKWPETPDDPLKR